MTGINFVVAEFLENLFKNFVFFNSLVKSNNFFNCLISKGLII